MAMEWYRMWHGMPNDDKLRVVSKRAKQPMANVIAVWSYLLDYASTREDRGSTEGIDAEAIAVCLDIEEAAVTAIFLALEEKERTRGNRIVNWEKLQPKREDDSAARVRNHRNKKRDVTHCNADVTQGNAPDTDTDTDTDTEKRREEVAEPPRHPVQIVRPQNPNINALFFSLTGRQPNSYQVRELVRISTDYPQDRIEYAFAEAGKAGADLRYVSAVLTGKGKKEPLNLDEIFTDEVAS